MKLDIYIQITCDNQLLWNILIYNPAGIVSLLSEIRVINDLGHPICGNLRDGDWLPEYIVGRLKFEPSTQRLAAWLEVRWPTVLRAADKALNAIYTKGSVTQSLLVSTHQKMPMLTSLWHQYQHIQQIETGSSLWSLFTFWRIKTKNYYSTQSTKVLHFQPDKDKVAYFILSRVFLCNM